MDWDLLLVTGALIGVIMLIALLGRIWQDQTPCRPSDGPPEKRPVSVSPGKLDKVIGHEKLFGLSEAVLHRLGRP